MMKSSKRRLQSLAEGSDIMSNIFKIDQDSECSIPPGFRARLYELFSQIEKEFDMLYTENISLQEKIDLLNERLERENYGGEKPSSDTVDFDAQGKHSKQKMPQSSQKFKASHKLKVQTSKIVSSFKAPSFGCQLVKEFTGHKDGIWEVTCGRPGQPLIGTACADYTAAVWSVENGRCLLQYSGHTGSVNSIRFHPSRDLALTSSGDTTAHVWQAAVNPDFLNRGQSSEEELDGDDGCGGIQEDRPESLRTPLVELSGHLGVVVAADWLPGADQVITASWDRQAHLYDVETGEFVQCLTGHDHELTHASAHFSQRLVVTASRDTTFRLWDFRESFHSVSVFQGHTESVTSAVFTREDKVVSGSDDRSVKVWDLRNMRSPLATIRSDSSVNRLAVSSSGIIGIPHDNRQVRLFDLQGQRMARLPRTSRMGHRRMVTSVAWTDETSSQINFFSCGFDRRVLGWSVQPSKET